MAISRLNDALERLMATGKPGDKVFARERGTGAACRREYVIMTAERAWQETIHNNQPHLYEVLSTPCNMYLDIEWKCKKPPVDEKNKLNDIILYTKEKLKEVYNIEDINVHTASASGWVGNEYKCSWHVHMVSKSKCWGNAACAGDFVRRHLSDIDEVDKVPYHAPKQNWRCVGSSKASDPQRVFTPITKKHFMDCMVGCHVGGRTVIGTSVSRKRQITPPAPPYVIQLVNMLGEMRIDNMIQMGNRYWCIPFMKRIHCVLANRTHRSNHQYAIVDLWGMRWRQKCHNQVCMHEESPWCQFPDVSCARKIWLTHVRPVVCDLPGPPARPITCPPPGVHVVHCPRLRGPPSSVPANSVVKCIDGYYLQ